MNIQIVRGDYPFMFSGTIEKRLPAMERVLFVHHGTQQRLYPFALVSESGVINDALGKLKIEIFGKQGTL